MKMTSAYASKVLRKLNEDKEFWRGKEEEGSLYVAALDEEPVVPEYDYRQVSETIRQIDRRKLFLDSLRKHDPKVRINSGLYASRKTAPEYQYINYDLAEVKEDYDRIDRELAAMQIALDRYNQTHEFEVEI